MYYKRTITIPNYGWKVEIYEPSLKEVVELKNSTASTDDASFTKILAGLITSWDATDRQGVSLPISAESLYNWPQPALKFFIQAVYLPKAEDEPKNA